MNDTDIRTEAEKIVRHRDMKAPDNVLIGDVVALGKRVRAEAVRNFAWNLAQVICPWCGEEGYNLVWHHNEWRHYRQYDQHVEYCQADRVYNLLPDDVLAAIRNGGQP